MPPRPTAPSQVTPLSAELAAILASLGLHPARIAHEVAGNARPIRALKRLGLPADPPAHLCQSLGSWLAAEWSRQRRIAAVRAAQRSLRHDHLAARRPGHALRAIATRRQAVIDATQREAERLARRQREDETKARLLGELAEWTQHPCRWRSARRQAEEMAGLVALDLASPGAFRRLMARVQAETIAHHLIRAGEWSLDHRSDSGSIYLRHRHRTTHQRLRLSDHDLGYGDYGTREQIHRGGPDIVFDGEGSFESVLADTLQAIADDAESRSACLVDC